MKSAREGKARAPMGGGFWLLLAVCERTASWQQAVRPARKARSWQSRCLRGAASSACQSCAHLDSVLRLGGPQRHVRLAASAASRGAGGQGLWRGRRRRPLHDCHEPLKAKGAEVQADGRGVEHQARHGEPAGGGQPGGAEQRAWDARWGHNLQGAVGATMALQAPRLSPRAAGLFGRAAGAHAHAQRPAKAAACLGCTEVAACRSMPRPKRSSRGTSCTSGPSSSARDPTGPDPADQAGGAGRGNNTPG